MLRGRPAGERAMAWWPGATGGLDPPPGGGRCHRRTSRLRRRPPRRRARPPRGGRQGRRRPGRDALRASSPPCSCAATCCSRACPAWPRRCWSRRWPPPSTSSSSACSSRPTSCRPTSSASSIFDADRRRVPLPRGPGVHQPAAGRRDQPHAAQDPGRAARGDGGAPGVVEGDGPPAARARSSSSPPRTRSSTRAPTRCPRPSSTGSCSSSRSATRRAEQEQEVLARHDRGLDPHDLAGAGVRPVASAADLAAARRRGRRRPGRGPGARLHRGPRAGPPASRRRSPSASRPAARPALLHAAKAWAWLAGRDFVTPDEVKAVAKPALRHRLLAPPRARARGRHRRRRARRHPRHRARRPAEARRPDARPHPPPRRRRSPWRRWSSLVAARRGLAGVLCWSSNGVLLVLVAVVDLVAGAAPGDGRRRAATCPAVVALGRRGRRSRWRVAQPGRAGGCACRWPTSWPRRCGAGARRVRGRRAAPGATVGASHHDPARPAGAGSTLDRGRRCASTGPLGPGRPPGAGAVPGAAAGLPAVPRRGTRPSCASTGPGILEVGLRSAPGPGRRHRVRPAARLQRRRRVPPHRLGGHARTGRPIVRTYRAERNQTVIVLLDNGRVMAGRVGDVPRVEHAMDAVMCSPRSPPASATGPGWSPSTARCGPSCRPAHGRDQLGRVTEAMYDLEPELVESDYRGRLHRRPWPASGAGRCSSCSPTWSSRRWARRCCRPCR